MSAPLLSTTKRSLVVRIQLEKYGVNLSLKVESVGCPIFCEQIDVVIFDQQHSPFIFKFKDQTIIPAESVYAVFEAKQAVNAGYINYAQKKISSVRRLHRTSLPIPLAGGVYPAKPLIPIIGGILSLDSDWNPPLGDSLRNSLRAEKDVGMLNIGCVAAHGIFKYDSVEEQYEFIEVNKTATAFIFELIAMLQFSGTVPMIDVRAYADWLK